jgi:hypothetical protein
LSSKPTLFSTERTGETGDLWTLASLDSAGANDVVCSQIFASASEFPPTGFLEPLEGVRRSEESVALARKLFAPSVRHQKKPHHQRADEHIKCNAHNIWISGEESQITE